MSVSHLIGLAASSNTEHWLSMRRCLVGQRETGHINCRHFLEKPVQLMDTLYGISI